MSSPADVEEVRPARLLIVDDVIDNRRILARRFGRSGFEITEAEDGAQALALIAAHAFDMVLLDIAMPGLDGFEVLRRIREHHASSVLPVIMVTANTQSMAEVEALNEGANDYLTKPVDFPVALARVGSHLGRTRDDDELRRANEALRQRNEALERELAALRGPEAA
jgi:DNA-binding response OmpR family regulator